MFETFETEILILGMDELLTGHCAENIQESIQKIVNQYAFDKSKIGSIKFFFLQYPAHRKLKFEKTKVLFVTKGAI